MPLLHHAAILHQLPRPLQPLVINRVPLPSAGVPRAVSAAPVRRRHLVLAALRTHRMLHAVVAHLRRQPGAAEASEARRKRRGQRRTAHVGSGRRGSGERRGGGGRRGGLRGLALCVQRRQRLADLLVARSQVWLLLPQLSEQRLGAELGIRQPQSADGLQQAVGHATSSARARARGAGAASATRLQV
eukprot:scaffold44628_cov46-Phaeocystis_antarctica.AAC.3